MSSKSRAAGAAELKKDSAGKFSKGLIKFASKQAPFKEGLLCTSNHLESQPLVKLFSQVHHFNHTHTSKMSGLAGYQKLVSLPMILH